MNIKHALLFLFYSIAWAQNVSYTLAPNPQILGPNGAAQPFVCQTAPCATANSGAEVLYIKATGVPQCSAMYSMGFYSGANQTNLSAIYSNFPSYLTYNASTPRYSPDGKWIIVASNGQSARVCTDTQAKPGAGFGYSLWLCRVSNTTCYEMAIEGDNVGNYCSVGVACPVNPAVLTNWVDDVHGVLHWYFTPDQTKIYGMYVMGATMLTPERLNGTARWASVTLPSSGAPTLSSVTETDMPPLGGCCGAGGIGNGANNWYEGAGAMPISVEPTTCTLFFTSINNISGSFNNTSILKYNICTGSGTYLPPSTAYQEHWNIRTQGDIGIGIDAEFLPPTLVFCLCGGVSGPTDLSIGPALVGKATQMTFFNNIRPIGDPVTSMSDPGWDWTGNYVVAEYVTQDPATHSAGVAGYILKYQLVTTPTPDVQVAGGTLAGAQTQ
jgi:hypothetical protein